MVTVELFGDLRVSSVEVFIKFLGSLAASDDFPLEVEVSLAICQVTCFIIFNVKHWVKWRTYEDIGLLELALMLEKLYDLEEGFGQAELAIGLHESPFINLA